MPRQPTQNDLSDLVRREVIHCVSSLISDLAIGQGSVERGEQTSGLVELCEEASELCNPVENYEDAAFEEGIEVRELDDGTWQYSTKADREEAVIWSPGEDETEEDRPGAWQDLDEADDEESAYRLACEAENVEPHQWEVYEHWIVSDWLARKLRAHGERVGECGGLTIWGRTTTGQAIAMDSIIETIWRELNANDADNGDQPSSAEG